MAGGLPNLPGGLPPLPPGGGPPGAPPPMAALAAARPSSPSGPPGAGGGGMSQMMLLFLAGLGFKDFVKSMTQLRGDKGKGDKQSQAGGLLKQLGAARSLPQNATTPPGGPSMPPMLAGGTGNPGLLAMLAQLAAATQGRGQM